MNRDPVNDAQQLITEGHDALFQVLPSVIKAIIRNEAWKARTKGPMDDGATFTSFREFVEYKLWWGLECPYDRLIRYIEHDAECKAMVLGESEGLSKHGEVGNGRSRGDNITSTDRGTQADYTIRRLKRDRPDLADAVIRGNLTANAAAIEAGFRRKKVQLEPTPEAFEKAIAKYLPGYRLEKEA